MKWRPFKSWFVVVLALLSLGRQMRAEIATSALQLWLKADSIQGVGDGQGISTWTDSSSYGRNATAYIGAPLLKNNIINGKPVVHFTGTQAFEVTDSPAWQLGNAYTIFFVARRNPAWRGDDWWSGIMMGQDNGSAQQGKWRIDFGGGSTSRDSVWIAGDGVAEGGFAISLPYDQYGLFELRMDGSRFEGYTNGNLSGFVDNVETVALFDLARPLTIGYWETIYDWSHPLPNSGFCGDIAELLIYNSAISHAQRQEVGAYLAEKYGFSKSYISIERQPEDIVAVSLASASFRVVATGGAPLTYRWLFNGAALMDGDRIMGAATTNLTISSVQSSDAGKYQVVVSNLAGCVTSVVATLTVTNNWTNYTSGTEVNVLVDAGTVLWVGSGGGLTRVTKSTGQMVHYNAANSGLPQNRVTALAAGTNGTLWIVTEFQQLVKFDGAPWSRIIKPEIMNGGPIGGLAVDKHGLIWIAFYGGLASYDGVKWSVYDAGQAGLSQLAGRALAIGNNENKWVATDQGLVRFDGATWRVYDASNSGLTGQACAVALDEAQNVWVGTSGQGVARFDGVYWTVFDQWNSRLPDDYVRCIASDHRGGVWVGTYRGLARYDGKQWTHYNAEMLLGFLDEDVSSAVVDEDGVAWIGYASGLARYDGKQWTALDTGNSPLPYNYITSLEIDSTGTKWIGTFYGGLAKLEGTNWTVYDTRTSGIPNNGVYVEAVDARGIIWLTLWNSEGAVRFDGVGWEHITWRNSGLPAGQVSSVACGANGSTWFLVEDTSSGSVRLAKYETNVWTVHNLPAGEPFYGWHAPSSLVVRPDGTVWVAVWQHRGVARFDGVEWSFFNQGTGHLASDLVAGMVLGSNGDLWILTSGWWDYATGEVFEGGLAKFDGMSWTRYDRLNSPIPDDSLFCLAADEAGAVWGISTGINAGQQLFRFDGTKWEFYDLETGGLPGTPNTLRVSSDGGLWFASMGGLGLASATGLLPGKSRLLIKHVADHVELRWVNTAPLTMVCGTESLTPPVQWRTLSGTPIDDGTWKRLDLPEGSVNGMWYYSLRKP